MRDLLHAYERRARVAKANATWSSLLDVARQGQDEVAKQQEQHRQHDAPVDRQRSPPADARSADAKRQRSLPPLHRGRLADTDGNHGRGAEGGDSTFEPAGGVHTAARSVSPGRRSLSPRPPVRAPFSRPRHARLESTESRSAAETHSRGGRPKPLPMIEQPVGVEAKVSSWPKKSLTHSSSATLQTAAANAAAARQANTAVAGSQLHAETREIFRGLLHTLDTQQPDHESRRAPPQPRRQLGAVQPPPRSAHAHLGAGASCHALHGACESVIATRHCGYAALDTTPVGACGTSSDMYASYGATPHMAHTMPAPSMSRGSGGLPPPKSSGGRPSGSRLRSSMSSSSLPPAPGPHGAPQLGASSSHASLGAGGRGASGPRHAFSAPLRWSRPEPHHPRQPTLPEPVLATWKEAAADGRPNQHGLSAKDRILQRTEAVLNERLASAAAALQSYKMSSLSGPDAHAHNNNNNNGGHAGGGASAPVATGGRSAGGRASLSRPPVHPSLKMTGEGLPSSNDRLGLILADLMG